MAAVVDQLDAPARLAMRWAWAWASLRAGASEVDSIDLVAGVMLADPTGNPARDLLAHFRIPPGAVVLRDNARAPELDALVVMWEQLPANERPGFDADGMAALDTLAQGRLQPGERWSIRDLFGAVVAGPTVAASRVRGLLGAAAPDVLGAYGDYLTSGQSYAVFLAARFPPTTTPIGVATYLADRPQRIGAELDRLPDLVDIRNEVNAFAYLIASTRLVPPLAVGLFGAWGSGKSFFINSLCNRIEEIAAHARDQTPPPGAVHSESSAADAARPEPPFHGAIVQIEFNAWQYVEGDLWSSLLEHLFRNLTIPGLPADDQDDLLTQARNAWITALRAEESTYHAAQQELSRAEDAHEQAAATVVLRAAERDARLAELDQQLVNAPLDSWRPNAELRNQIQKALADAGIIGVSEQGAELTAALEHARRTLNTSTTLAAVLRARGLKYVLAVVFAVVIGPAVAVVLGLLDVSAVVTAASTVGVVVGTIATYARRAATFLDSANTAITEAQDDLAAAQQQERANLTSEVDQAALRLTNASAALANARHAVADRAASLANARTELAATTPDRVLTEFLADRSGSDDYRRNLGVPALVRRDLQRLSALLNHPPTQQQPEHSTPPLEQPAMDGLARIQRIVLYIDDLDRCPTEQVIKVLEAVHLLLSFPLFVVVVAVDSHWLESSLRHHFQQLTGHDATPEDYLEKIFQVPFQIRPLGEDIRARMLDGLLRPSITTPGTATPANDGPSTRISPSDRAALDTILASLRTTEPDQPMLDAASLTITENELTEIRAVAALAGATPRALKRFVNSYLLIKAMGNGHGLTMPADGRLPLLLAITTGLPYLAPTIREAIAATVALMSTANSAADQPDSAPPVGLDLNAVVDKSPPLEESRRHLSDHDALAVWLSANPDRATVELSDLIPWLSLLDRFRFATNS